MNRIAKFAKWMLLLFCSVGVAAVSWIMFTTSPAEYMTIEVRQIVTGFVIKAALATVGFFGIKTAFLHLISSLRANDFKFKSEMARAVFYSTIFFALAFFLALILI